MTLEGGRVCGKGAIISVPFAVRHIAWLGKLHVHHGGGHFIKSISWNNPKISEWMEPCRLGKI
jgi:hypothetical protein